MNASALHRGSTSAAPALVPDAETVNIPSPDRPIEDGAGQTGWDPAWENNVYGQGRHLNRYPHHAVVGFVFRHYGRVVDRQRVQFCELGCGAGNNVRSEEHTPELQ